MGQIFGKPRKQRIDGSEQQIGAVTARDTGERGREPQEDDRDQDAVAGGAFHG